jgi:hypothetical protein
MHHKTIRRPSHATIVAYLALFAAVGTGSAYAANTVFSSDIVDGEVKSVDIGNGEVGSADVKDGSLNTFDVHTFLGVDVVDNSLTGDDVQESTLGKVPAAGNADTLEGQSLAQVKSSVVARPEGNSSVPVGTQASPANYPLAGNTWTQPADSLQFTYGHVTVSFPAGHACLPNAGSIKGNVSVLVDGVAVASLDFEGAGTRTFSLAQPIPLFSPDTDTARTATVRAYDNCQAQHSTIDSVTLYEAVLR